ncbi:hypothetical protein [Roseateles depolymerans]|uniref:Uncharacterized protein n=1 Tax=Roseateles depolymerans TaxID=76731 RepID=A0A0U3D0E1_9BURK|nr:hypothetical protein [Roseateles depolymerans]ALV07046.1 hypothetical protein RD2015_2581 [Roseateles depolymerans]REG20029.1 hypothetical protein DES44_2535 [Roseateles depolymerans]
MNTNEQRDQDELDAAKAFWVMDPAAQRLTAPRELTLAELQAVAGGPEVEGSSSN